MILVAQIDPLFLKFSQLATSATGANAQTVDSASVPQNTVRYILRASVSRSTQLALRRFTLGILTAAATFIATDYFELTSDMTKGLPWSSPILLTPGESLRASFDGAAPVDGVALSLAWEFLEFGVGPRATDRFGSTETGQVSPAMEEPAFAARDILPGRKGGPIL